MNRLTVLVVDGIRCLLHINDGEAAQASGTDVKTTHTDFEPDVAGCRAEIGNDECCMIFTTVFFQLFFPFHILLYAKSKLGFDRSEPL